MDFVVEYLYPKVERSDELRKLLNTFCVLYIPVTFLSITVIFNYVVARLYWLLLHPLTVVL